jgi:hypothetical protein
MVSTRLGPKLFQGKGEIDGNRVTVMEDGAHVPQHLHRSGEERMKSDEQRDHTARSERTDAGVDEPAELLDLIASAGTAGASRP